MRYRYALFKINFVDWLFRPVEEHLQGPGFNQASKDYILRSCLKGKQKQKRIGWNLPKANAGEDSDLSFGLLTSGLDLFFRFRIWYPISKAVNVDDNS